MATRRTGFWLENFRRWTPWGLGLGFVAWAPAARAADKPVGGHVGIAVPFVTLADPVTSISDQFTGHVVDPGGVYDWGPAATGLRLAFQIGNRANIGLIPLVNVGLVDLGGAKWFVEGAFPLFYVPKDVSLTIVAHTGVGF